MKAFLFYILFCTVCSTGAYLVNTKYQQHQLANLYVLHVHKGLQLCIHDQCHVY